METSEFKRPIRKMWKRGVANLKRKIFDEMTSEEHEFVIQCLLHTEGAIVVKADEVAAALGAATARTVTAKIKDLKDRYNLPIRCTGTKATNIVAMIQDDGDTISQENTHPDKAIDSKKRVRSNDEEGDPDAALDDEEYWERASERMREFNRQHNREDDPHATEDDEVYGMRPQKRKKRVRLSDEDAAKRGWSAGIGGVQGERALSGGKRSPRTIDAAETLMKASRGTFS